MQKKKDKSLMKTDVKPMKQGLLSRIFHLYYDGFRTMTHWLFVPLTLGLAVIMGIAETYYRCVYETAW